jgi:hypothetical protein
MYSGTFFMPITFTPLRSFATIAVNQPNPGSAQITEVRSPTVTRLPYFEIDYNPILIRRRCIGTAKHSPHGDKWMYLVWIKSSPKIMQGSHRK